MHITRRGKIARLPAEIRRQLNQRLRDGEPGASLVQWLNSLPEMRTIIANEFGGKPVREQNLSDWRQGGYAQWLVQQEAVEMAPPVAAELQECAQAAGGPVLDQMSLWLAVQYLMATRKITESGADAESNWTRLRAFCHDLQVLRRGEHDAGRLKFEREKFGYSQSRAEHQALKFCLAEAKQYPEVFETFRTAFKLLHERKAGRNSPPVPA